MGAGRLPQGLCRSLAQFSKALQPSEKKEKELTVADGLSIAEIRKRLLGLSVALAEKYEVESMELFGSYVREEQSESSDLDVLVTFRTAPSLFKFVELENLMAETLGVKVDLVMKDVLKPGIRERILEEAVSI